MTKLSVNINKVATLRNARGGNMPNVVQFALDCEAYGADGITVHPRPDERHITYDDVYALSKCLHTEFNIEGNPTPDFCALVLAVKPAQVTLVPDAPDALTSNAGWDTRTHFDFLRQRIAAFRQVGIRTSLFMDPDAALIALAAQLGADRIELYTGPYAEAFESIGPEATAPFVAAAKLANELGMGVNAGHDLNRDNLAAFHHALGETLDEVSIGHALISDALYLGIQQTIQEYNKALKS